MHIERLEDLVARNHHVNQPHRHSAHYLLFITQGSGRHIVDFVSYEVRPCAVFLMTPGQVHAWELSDDVRGFVVLFEEAFLRSEGETSITDMPLFRAYGAGPVFYLDCATDSFVRDTLGQLLDEYQQKSGHRYRDEVLRSYLQLLLFKLCRFREQSRTRTLPTHLYQQINQYRQLIEANFLHIKIVTEYAGRLHITPKHLNAICQKVLGKKASVLIQERVILEARRLLVHSDYTVQRIAYELNFSEPSYFVRYFRKATGATPERFRQQALEEVG